MHWIYGAIGLAQLAHNEKVPGSSPGRSTFLTLNSIKMFVVVKNLLSINPELENFTLLVMFTKTSDNVNIRVVNVVGFHDAPNNNIVAMIDKAVNEVLTDFNPKDVMLEFPN